MKKYIGSIDQGTTSTRFIIFDKDTNIIASHQIEHKQIYPNQGWVEHDPNEIWKNTQRVISETLLKADIDVNDIESIGITNQRETVLAWNKATGKPLYNAIVWQDTRTSEFCRKYEQDYEKSEFRNITGLPLNTYFSASKISWLINNVNSVKVALDNDELLVGTIDTWLTWNLTGGNHLTDITNASRTLLMNLETMNWDDRLLNFFNIPKNILPEIKPSSYTTSYGSTVLNGFNNIPINGCLGDQQAALFGQNCINEGDAKNTYGTGCFLLLNTGQNIVSSKHGLLTTVAFQFNNEKPTYALEGSVAIAGSLVQWLRDNFGIISSSSEIEDLAKKVDDNGGVYFVPAFTGLFAPYWNKEARGLIIGLTHYNNKSHIARAVLEAAAFQSYDVFTAMQKDSGIELNSLKVDGGMTANNLLMQFQSDILDREIIRPKIIETTALGAAYAAGLATGFWKNFDEISALWKKDSAWNPKMSADVRKNKIANWEKAVKRSLDWC
jgi:glycerol kinase